MQARADLLEIRFGGCLWLKAAEALLAVLGLLAILVSPANWKWKIASIVLLVLLGFFLHARSIHGNRSGIIRLGADSTALLQTASGLTINAVQGPHGWSSRWVSVLTLVETDDGRKHHCVICASENRPDDYRLFLKQLRMCTPTEARSIIW